MEENNTVNEEESNIQSGEYAWETVYEFLLVYDDWISSNDIMKKCNISRVQFYSSLDQLRRLRLIEVKVDMKDLRKKYYKALKRKDKVL